VDHDEALGRDAVVRQRLAHGCAGLVHEGARLQQHELLSLAPDPAETAGRREPGLGDLRPQLTGPGEPDAGAAGEFVDDEVAGVVPVRCVGRARITEPDQ
jgi:hypothetical protein